VPQRNIVVIGASAGGIEAVSRVLRSLPPDFAASVFIVVHTAPDSPGILGSIFDQAGPLPAAQAIHRERIRPGRVYVAPPDHHLLIVPGKVVLSRGPRENRFRPAIDPLFRSAAQTYGPRVIGVVLTGGLDDGTNGLWTIKRLGGTAVVQDPDEALSPSMPRSAVAHVSVDHLVRLEELGPLLVRLTAGEVEAEPVPTPEEVSVEVSIAGETNAKEAGVMSLGEPSNYACPECHGVLLQMREANPMRFRCHTGHAYTLDSLLSEMDVVIEESLWNAIRALEERAMLMRHAGAHARHAHDDGEKLLEDAADSQRRADLVRQAAMSDAHENAVESGS